MRHRFRALLTTLGLMAACCCAPAQAQAPTSDDSLVGPWELSYYKPGVVEPGAAYLLVTDVTDGEIRVELRFSGKVIPLESRIDPETGVARFEVQGEGTTKHMTLCFDDDVIDGEAFIDQHFVVRGRRIARLPEGDGRARAEVDFGVEQPRSAARGALSRREHDEVDARVLESIRTNRIVGVSVAIVRDGELLDVLSYGWEDFGDRIPATQSTMYRWASVAKTLTAASAVRAASEGAMDLHADTRDALPEFDHGVTITCDQLLRHTAGVPHYDQMRARAFRDAEDPALWEDRVGALRMLEDSDLVGPPGEQRLYSTPGYVVLGAVMERSLDEGYLAYVRRAICEPLGMKSMRPDYASAQFPHHAAAYERFEDEGVVLETPLDDIGWKLPAGGWISEPGDMARFAIGLMDGKVLDADSMQLLTQPDGDNTEHYYARGVVVDRTGEHTLLSHSGGQTGATTFLLMRPGTRDAIAILSNTEGARGFGQLARELLDVITDSPPDPG